MMLSEQSSGPIFVTVNLPTVRLPPSTGQYCYQRTASRLLTSAKQVILDLFVNHAVNRVTRKFRINFMKFLEDLGLEIKNNELCRCACEYLTVTQDNLNRFFRIFVSLVVKCCMHS